MGWKDYFSSLFNYVDLTSSVINLTILLWHDITGHSVSKDIMIPLAVLLMWLKSFYWMRIFNQPAFYIKLVVKTLTDILGFLLILILAIGATANLFYIVTMWRKNTGEYDDHYLFSEEYEKEPIINSLIYTYKLGLGEFDTDMYQSDKNNSVLLWTFFLSATLIVQITILNMLIAIMGDTFDRVMETKLESALKEKIDILADFRIILKLLKIDFKSQYVLIITPAEELQEESEQW